MNVGILQVGWETADLQSLADHVPNLAVLTGIHRGEALSGAAEGKGWDLS